MNILALETSTDLASIALRWQGVVSSLSLQSPPAHSASLLPAIKRLLMEQGACVSGMDRIVCGIGPGSFTGVRLACSVAQGLALAADLRIVPICSLLALAEASGAKEVYCAMDARMNEVYVAAYRASGNGWQEVLAPRCVSPGALPSPGDGRWVCLGTAFSAYPAAIDGVQDWSDGIPASMHPDASALLTLATQFEAQDAAWIAPLYVRDRVALTVAERLALGGKA